MMNNTARTPDETPEQEPVTAGISKRSSRLTTALATAAAALSLLASTPASAETQNPDMTELSSGSSGEGGNGEKEKQEAERVVKDHLKSINFTSGTFEINKKNVKVTYDAKADRLAVDQKLEGAEISLLYQKLLSL